MAHTNRSVPANQIRGRLNASTGVLSPFPQNDLLLLPSSANTSNGDIFVCENNRIAVRQLTIGSSKVL